MTQPGDRFMGADGRWRYAGSMRYAPAPDGHEDGGKGLTVDDRSSGGRPGDERLGDDASTTGELAELRGVAMAMARDLQHMMPQQQSAGRASGGAQALKSGPAALGKPEFERLLSRNDGVIDGFAKLVQLVIRIRDKELETREQTQSILPIDEFDEDELDRRIAEELDRIAERRRAAAGLAAAEGQEG